MAKSFVDTFKRNSKLKKKFKILNLVSKSFDEDLKKVKFINTFKFDLEKNFGSLPKPTKYIIYAADPNDYKLYKSNKNKNINKIKKFIKLYKKNYYDSNLIYLSSGIVYGKQTKEVSPKENTKFRSLNTVNLNQRNYCYVKRFGEKEICKLKKKKFKISIARLYSFIGSKIQFNRHFLMGNLIRNISNKKKQKIYLSGKFCRSYLHADNMVYFILKIVQIANKNCPIYNLGSDEIINEKTILNIFQDFTKRKLIKKNKKLDYYIPNISKLRYRFSIKQKFNFKKDLMMTLRQLKLSLN